MSYLYDGETHDNYDPAFMAELGMSEEVIASVLAQHNYELTEGQLARRQRAYVAESDPSSVVEKSHASSNAAMTSAQAVSLSLSVN